MINPLGSDIILNPYIHPVSSGDAALLDMEVNPVQVLKPLPGYDMPVNEGLTPAATPDPNYFPKEYVYNEDTYIPDVFDIQPVAIPKSIPSVIPVVTYGSDNECIDCGGSPVNYTLSNDATALPQTTSNFFATAMEWIKMHPTKAALIIFAVYYLFNANYKKT